MKAHTHLAQLSLLLLTCHLPVLAGEARSLAAVSEYQVKAAFLYNFAHFVEWPLSVLPVDGPLVIGIYGKDPFDGGLASVVAGKSIGGRSVVVQKISQLAGFRGCHVVFIPGMETKSFREIAHQVADMPVLTVGESAGFAERLGIINMVTEDGHISFEINPAAAARGHLVLSSKLLRLATLLGKPIAAK